MKKEELISYQNWFYTYADSFINKDQNFNYHINLKKAHCKRVSEEIVCLGKSLGLESADLTLAELIGLYHDLGRFEQYSTYKTFSDEKSRDHAELGEVVVKDAEIFANLDSQERSIIFSSIRLHNKLSLTGDLNERKRFFINLLRDADKLDIWKVLIKHYRSEEKDKNTVLLDLPDIPCISDEVAEAVIHKRLVRKEHIKTVNDFIILNMSWVFDLNFHYTLQEVMNRKYITTLINLLPDNTLVRNITDIVTMYLENNSYSTIDQ